MLMSEIWKILTNQTIIPYGRPFYEKLSMFPDSSIDEILCSFISDYDLSSDKPLRPANEVIDILCNFLLDYPGFQVHSSNDVTLLSEGMLAPCEEEKFLDKNGVIFDILIPNLYCTLLLMAKGQKVSEKDAKALNKLHNDESRIYDPEISKYYKRLAKFPTMLNSLFCVEQNSGGNNKSTPYQIRTSYPKLFLAVVNNFQQSPLEHTESWAMNRNFLERCLDAIAPTQEWTLNSYESYYLLERLFRIKAKTQLCYGSCKLSKEKQQEPKTISPLFLADYFYSSPLVFFPERFLESIFCPTNVSAELLLLENAKTLHFLIQISSYWFPFILTLMDTYLGEHELTTYDAISKYLFPKSEDIQPVFRHWSPDIKFPGADCDKKFIRRFQDMYARKWREFGAPIDNYMEYLRPKRIEDWVQSALSNRYSVEDMLTLHAIQDSLIED